MMKCSSETLQNLPYFWNMKTHIDFFILCYFIFFLMLTSTKWKMEKNYSISFHIPKICKFWSVLLGHFIKHKPLIYEIEECFYYNLCMYVQYIHWNFDSKLTCGKKHRKSTFLVKMSVIICIYFLLL